MARLNIERQKELEPKRMEYAIQEIEKLGHQIEYRDDVKIKFTFKGFTVTFYPYSGWAAGKSINDGRGIENLLKQIR